MTANLHETWERIGDMLRVCVERASPPDVPVRAVLFCGFGPGAVEVAAFARGDMAAKGQRARRPPEDPRVHSRLTRLVRLRAVRGARRWMDPRKLLLYVSRKRVGYLEIVVGEIPCAHASGEAAGDDAPRSPWGRARIRRELRILADLAVLGEYLHPKRTAPAAHAAAETYGGRAKR